MRSLLKNSMNPLEMSEISGGSIQFKYKISGDEDGGQLKARLKIKDESFFGGLIHITYLDIPIEIEWENEPDSEGE